MKPITRAGFKKVVTYEQICPNCLKMIQLKKLPDILDVITCEHCKEVLEVASLKNYSHSAQSALFREDGHIDVLEFRKRFGFRTQKELAVYMDCSSRTVEAWEQQIRYPGPRCLRIMERVIADGKQ